MLAENDKLIQIRQQFPLLQQQINGHPLVYLDNAATTQKPQVVLDAMQDYYLQYNSNVHRGSHSLSNHATELYEDARQRVATFIHAADSREIIWTRGATEAINLVANSWGQRLKEGDEILLTTLEHHANIVPWQMLAQRCGAIIKVAPLLKNGDLDLDAFSKLLNTRTQLVAVAHISNVLGTINPIQDIIAQAHANGSLVLIDGAQAAPHCPIDVQALDADFYAFSGHKVFAPTGIGVLWAKSEILESMPPWQGGGEMIRHVSFSGTEFNDSPFRFEAGTPNISGAIALGEALNWLQHQDRELLLKHETQLMEYALEGCQQIKDFERIANPTHCASLFSFTLKNLHQHDAGLLLDQRGIALRGGHHCAMPLMEAMNLPGTLRASFTFYNSFSEVEQFVAALEQVTSQDLTHVSAPPKAESNPDIIEELTKLKGWNDRYRQIMQLGKTLPHMPDNLKKIENLIQGCESKTWLNVEKYNNCSLHFSIDSEARVIRGLLSLVLSLVQDKTADEIQKIDIFSIFSKLELDRHLSPSRGNGLRAVIEKIYQITGQPDASK